MTCPPAAFARAWLDEYEAATYASARAATRLLGTLTPSGPRPPLHWERTGAGTPVLLIMGVGLSSGAWWRTVPVLAGELEVVTFDNRGVGRSSARLHAYSTEVMADDAVSVLDAARIDRAHIYGISLGGMVAQQVALRHPDRVHSLVLGATQPGGPESTRPPTETLAFLMGRTWMPHRQAARIAGHLNYSAGARADHPERIAADLEQRLAHPFPIRAYHAQMWAATMHDTSRLLHRITAPTLVVHGTDDRMIPVANGRLLARAIPGAQLLELPQTGHLYPTERPDVDAEIRAFMRRHA